MSSHSLYNQTNIESGDSKENRSDGLNKSIKGAKGTTLFLISMVFFMLNCIFLIQIAEVNTQGSHEYALKSRDILDNNCKQTQSVLEATTAKDLSNAISKSVDLNGVDSDHIQQLTDEINNDIHLVKETVCHR